MAYKIKLILHCSGACRDVLMVFILMLFISGYVLRPQRVDSWIADRAFWETGLYNRAKYGGI